MVDLIEKMKAEISIRDLADRLGLKGIDKGDHAEYSCPLCKEEPPHRHLYLYYHDNKFHCFKCKTSGDIFNLYMLVKICPLSTAIKRVKKMYGYEDSGPREITMFERVFGSQNGATTPEVKKPPPKPIIDVQDGEIQSIYFDLADQYLKLTARGREYLSRRGISDETIKRFKLLSIDEPKKIREILIDRYKMEKLVESGLFYIQESKPQFSFWKPGIVFVHYRPTHIAALSERAYDGKPKYLKLKGIPSAAFEGFLNGEKSLFVFEGILDGLSFYELTGKANFVAIGGILSPYKYKHLLNEYPDRKIVVALDPDKAGSNALERIENCFYLKYDELCKKLGLAEIPKHSDGKPYDINDLLIHIRGIK